MHESKFVWIWIIIKMGHTNYKENTEREKQRGRGGQRWRGNGVVDIITKTYSVYKFLSDALVPRTC